jgi:phosphonate transport system substrate-binding protein
MIDRRSVLLAVAASTMFATVGAANASDWKAKYPELVFAVIPSENASSVNDRYGPMMEYLGKQLGVKVTLRVAADYAAVIEGQRAGQIHIGYYGPSSFARALMIGSKVEAVAQEVNADGTKGYYSVLWVKKDNPATKLQDLKGKNLCLVDPNSTSGNNVPRFAMDKMGIDPDKFFGKVAYAGSHENAIIGVQQGTCDAAYNWFNDENESMLMRMDRKGMAKFADFKMIFKSDQIVNSPIAVLGEMPADLKMAIKDALLSIAKNDPKAFETATDGKQKPYETVDNKAYDTIIELNKFVDQLKKKSS